MDLATLVGIVVAFGIVSASMAMGGSILVFVNIPSMLVVFGGTLGAVMMKYNLSQYLAAFKIAGKAFMFKIIKPEELIPEIVELSDAARKGGLLSLEGKEVGHPFLQKGIGLLVDGHDPEVVRSVMKADRGKAITRHETSAGVFAAFGDVAPAMGMIGTLIGLVQMLSAMDDPKSIGPAMAIALLTTLYGAMIATMVALPIKDKLMLRSEEEGDIQALIIDAIIAIQGGQNPRVIQNMLSTYLKEKDRLVEED